MTILFNNLLGISSITGACPFQYINRSSRLRSAREIRTAVRYVSVGEHRLLFYMPIRNDHGAAAPSSANIRRAEKKKEEEEKEDDSETCAHYPIVGSALANGVYGDSKS